MQTDKPISVSIRNTETGETISFEDVGFFDKDGFSDYIWSDGNYACDCNRDIFFRSAKGLDELDDNPCGEDKYSVQIIDKTTGSIVYGEFET